MLRSALLGLSITLAACSRGKPAPAPPVSSSPAPVVAAAHPGAAPSDAGVASSWPAALPKPTLAAAGPIKVTGYPKPLRTCLPDPAHIAGFTGDGEELGYCKSGMVETCEFLDRKGHVRREDVGDGPGGDGPPSPAQKAKQAKLEAWLKTAGIPSLPSKDCQFFPPALAGTWPFADIELSVVEVEGAFKKTAKGDEPVSEAMVKIGGKVEGEPAVYPLAHARPGRKPNEPARYSNGTQLNVLMLSPDGSELGFVTHTNCMEWCDEFEIVRMPIERFASLVYNDAGFRAYKEKKLDRAIALFLRASYVDASRELPAYNLACAYARSGDAVHAEAALDLAIRRGGEPVKKRAKADADFASVKTAPWFARATDG